jgi:hypothetical protein
MLQDSSKHKSTRVKFKVEAVVPTNVEIKVSLKFWLESNFIHDSFVFTDVIHLVNFKFLVDLEEWEDTWYKGEEGKDNCMIANIHLQKADGTLATGIKVPFNLTIRYADSAIPVENQNILNAIGSSKQLINPGTGKSVIKFRVEDLSENHQGRDFQIGIAVDDTVQIFDIAPAYSSRFTVYSKKRKQQKLVHMGEQVSGSSRPCEEPPKITEAIIEHDPTTTPASIEFQQTSFAQHLLAEHLLSSSDPPDVHRTRAALYNVVDWAHKVVNELHSIQWKVVGYETKPDGSVDLSEPVHDKPNPNETISKLLSS